MWRTASKTFQLFIRVIYYFGIIIASISLSAVIISYFELFVDYPTFWRFLH